MMKHTPGPWTASHRKTQKPGASICGVFWDSNADWSKWDWVIVAEGRDDWTNDVEANARLIAAAPELLEALVGLYEHTRNNHQIAGLNAMALKAIEKAIGRPAYTTLTEEEVPL